MKKINNSEIARKHTKVADMKEGDSIIDVIKKSHEIVNNPDSPETERINADNLLRHYYANRMIIEIIDEARNNKH